MTPEAKVKAKIRAYLKSIPGCWFFMPIGGPFTVHGVPDIIGLVDGAFFGIEVKAPGKETNVTANQESAMAAINGAGGLAFVASNVASVRARFVQKGWDNDRAD